MASLRPVFLILLLLAPDLLSGFSFKRELFTLSSSVAHLAESGFSGFSCSACKTASHLLQHLINTGVGRKEIVSIARRFCTTFRIGTDKFCEGIVDEFQEEVIYVFSKSMVDPVELCTLAVGNSCSDPDHRTDNWTVPIPPVPKPPVQPVSPPKAGSPTLRVLQISDIHLDLQYKVGASAVCEDPLCCRDTSGVAASAGTAAGIWGDARKCDTPLTTLQSLLKYASKLGPIDYILWTGDDPPHDIWIQTRQHQIKVIRKVAGLLKQYFPKTPVFPALGNHEGVPVNSFPPPSVMSPATMSWLYDELNQTWGFWLPSKVLPTVNKGAFYSILVKPKFRIISLNMNYCNDKNWWLLLNSTDPVDELHWLVWELQKAETLGEKVHIIGHIPPGVSDCLQTWSRNYYRIINRYESTIMAQFFGHTHFDEFEVFYDIDDNQPVDHAARPTNIAYVGPSVTTFVSLNPAFRIYTIDGGYENCSWAVIDHETHYLNLTEANLSGKPNWKRLYSAKEAYNLPNLQPENWNDLIRKMKGNLTLFNQYYSFYYRYSPLAPSCDNGCRDALLCNMQSGRSYDPSLCAAA